MYIYYWAKENNRTVIKTLEKIKPKSESNIDKILQENSNS